MTKTSMHWILLGVLALAPEAVLAQQAAQPKTEAAKGQTEKPRAKKEETKKEEAKKEDEKKLTEDDSRRPVDKEVFMRMLLYYEIRSETARPTGATTRGNAAATSNETQRRKP